MVPAEIRPDGRQFVRQQREKLLQIEVAQAGRRGVVAEETKDEGRPPLGSRNG
jgi:hypothetical protein